MNSHEAFTSYIFAKEGAFFTLHFFRSAKVVVPLLVVEGVSVEFVLGWLCFGKSFKFGFYFRC